MDRCTIWLLTLPLFISPHIISIELKFSSLSSFFLVCFCSFEACFSTPQVNPNQWSQLAMAPMVAAPQTDPYDIPRAPMGAPLAIPEAPLYHQMPSSPFVGTQMPYQPGDQNPYQREVGAYNPAVGLGSNYNGQYVNHHNHHQPSDPADTRPMWVPPSPY